MSSQPFSQRASWIWSAEGSHAVPPAGQASPSHYQVRLFRRVFEVADPKARVVVHVSADSRYLLYLNGALVSRGPARGDIHHHFYETCDLTGRLQPGRNVLAALVLDMSRVAHRPTALGAPCAIMTYTGGFLLEGEVVLASGTAERLDTGLPGWRVQTDRAHRFQNEGTRFEGYLGYFEHRVSAEMPAGWNQAEFDDRAWPAATTLYLAERHENRRDPTSPYGLLPRMIPPLEEERIDRFSDVFIPGGGEAGADWRALLASDRPLEIPAGRTVTVILDAGKLTTAYPELLTRGGAGAKLRFKYAEALRLPWTTPGAKLLGKPQPLANLASHFADEANTWTFDRRGQITGWSDIWEPAGAAQEAFEPWHWRAFRYLGLEITTGAQPLVLASIRHRFAAYPYKIAADFKCSDARLERIWTTALRATRSTCPIS